VTALRTAAICLLALALTTAWSGRAYAQGHGHGPPGGHGKPPTGENGAGDAGNRGLVHRNVNAAAGLGPTGSAEYPVRNFGSWVDDAYVLPMGEAWVGVGFSYWRLPYAEQLDAPSLMTSVGVARRVHVSATLPMATIRYPDGYSLRRLGDTYVSAKIGLRAANHGVGIAVSPLLEVLADGSWPTPDGGTLGRVHWAVPVNLEYRGPGWRVYGSAGYFSRGAVFGSATLDLSLGGRAGLLGLISHTYSTHDPLTAPDVPVHRSRTDASGGLYVSPRSAISLYALAGRTISQIDDYASTLFVTTGVSFKIAQAKPIRQLTR
jgi:hypothetical protein